MLAVFLTRIFFLQKNNCWLFAWICSWLARKRPRKLWIFASCIWYSTRKFRERRRRRSTGSSVANGSRFWTIAPRWLTWMPSGWNPSECSWAELWTFLTELSRTRTFWDIEYRKYGLLPVEFPFQSNYRNNLISNVFSGHDDCRELQQSPHGRILGRPGSLSSGTIYRRTGKHIRPGSIFTIQFRWVRKLRESEISAVGTLLKKKDYSEALQIPQDLQKIISYHFERCIINLFFIAGKHRCMGEVLAKSNVFLFTATLLQAFTFSPVPGEEKPRQVFTDGVTANPVPFRVLVSRRS